MVSSSDEDDAGDMKTTLTETEADPEKDEKRAKKDLPAA